MSFTSSFEPIKLAQEKSQWEAEKESAETYTRITPRLKTPSVKKIITVKRMGPSLDESEIKVKIESILIDTRQSMLETHSSED